jgi:hypothetical protein
MKTLRQLIDTIDQIEYTGHKQKVTEDRSVYDNGSDLRVGRTLREGHDIKKMFDEATIKNTGGSSSFEQELLKVKHDYRHIYEIPPEFQTDEFYLAAVKQNPDLLSEVPDEFLSYEMCQEAIRRDTNVFEFVPEEFKTPELCLDVVRRDPQQLQYVPEEHMSDKLLKVALNRELDALDYVPDDLKTPELQQWLLRQYRSSKNQQEYINSMFDQ